MTLNPFFTEPPDPYPPDESNYCPGCGARDDESCDAKCGEPEDFEAFVEVQQ